MDGRGEVETESDTPVTDGRGRGFTDAGEVDLLETGTSMIDGLPQKINDTTLATSSWPLHLNGDFGESSLPESYP